MRTAKTVTLSQENIRDVDLLSRLEGVSFSNMVDRILQEYLRQEDIRERITKASEIFTTSQEET